MRIGIDAYPLSRKTKTGIGYYTEYLLKHLLEHDNKNQYFLYNNQGSGIRFSYPNLHLSSSCGRNLLNKFSTSWMLFNAKHQLIKDKIDMFWGTQGIIPIAPPKTINTVITVYDLTFYLYPETMAVDNYLVNRFLLKRSIINSDKIIAISDSTANVLKGIFRESNIQEKISVVYSGIDTNKFRKIDETIAGQSLLRKLNVSKEFILFVGTIEPRKNITGLLRAFKHLKTKYNIPHQLILAGASGWKTTPIYKVYKDLSFREGEVRFLGYISEEALLNLYSCAKAFIMPSFYEGFGMPLLEAISCGVPVVASDIAVFREVLDGAALFTDPSSPQEIALAISEVLTNKALAQELRHKGFNRAKLFSWGKAAQETLSIFERLYRGI